MGTEIIVKKIVNMMMTGTEGSLRRNLGAGHVWRKKIITGLVQEMSIMEKGDACHRSNLVLLSILLQQALSLQNLCSQLYTSDPWVAMRLYITLWVLRESKFYLHG